MKMSRTSTNSEQAAQDSLGASETAEMVGMQIQEILKGGVSGADPSQILKVGVANLPPFAIVSTDSTGKMQVEGGYAVELWEHIANATNTQYGTFHFAFLEMI